MGFGRCSNCGQEKSPFKKHVCPEGADESGEGKNGSEEEAEYKKAVGEEIKELFRKRQN